MAKKKVDLTGVDVLMGDAIRRGLQKADANMVRVANDILNAAEVDDTLNNLSIEIVPYDIEDRSLRQIVLEAPDSVVDEVVDALKERRRRAEFGALADVS